MKKVYLITADTCSDDYGVIVTCFGVATNDTTLKHLTDEVVVKGFEPKITPIIVDALMQEILDSYVE